MASGVPPEVPDPPEIRVPEGRTLHEGRKFDIRLVPRLGGRWESEVIVHPGAVVVLALRPGAAGDDEVLLVKNQRYPIGQELLELPAGTLEPGEDVEVCALRELEEETGYRANSIERLGAFFTAPGFCTELLHAFLATDLEPSEQNLDEGEELEAVAMPLAELQDLVRRGQVFDAKTLAALCLYWQRGDC